MKKVLLDTSVVIDFIRRSNKENTLLFRLAKEKHRLYVSILTHAEVYSGKSIWEKPEAAKEAEKLFSGMEIVPLDIEISRKAGNLNAHNTKTLIDAIIAATGLYLDIPLVTFNIKDFETIEGLQLYTSSTN